MADKIRCKNKRLFQVPILRQPTGNNAVNGSFISFLKYYLEYLKQTFLSVIVRGMRILQEFAGNNMNYAFSKQNEETY